MIISQEDIINEAKRVVREEIKSLEKIHDNISESFAEAAILISKAEKIIVSGVGKSGIIGRKIAATFASLGIPSIFMHPVDALHGDIGIVSKNDVAILLSKSGTTEELLEIVPFLKSRSAKIISIVGNVKSFLAYYSDIVLDSTVDKEACPLNIVPTSSTIASLAIGDALAAVVIKLNKINIEDFSRQHPLGQIGRNITLQVKDVMHSNSALPFIYSGSFFKDALIEITNKRLGCVCIVDKDKKLKGIITDGDVRRTLQKYDDIRGLKVEKVMTHKPIMIQAEAYLGEALSLMSNRESQISVMPVTTDKHICIGVIRLHDIVRSNI